MHILQRLETLVLLLFMYDMMRMETLIPCAAVLHGSIIIPQCPYVVSELISGSQLYLMSSTNPVKEVKYLPKYEC